MKILLTSHGDFCYGLLESYEMIAGKNANIKALSLTDEGVEPFREKLNTLLDELTESDQVLVFCDLKGGTPFNESYKYFLENEDKLRIISGMNLPMLIETGLVLETAEDIDALVATTVETGKNAIEAELVDASNDDEEDDLGF